MVPRPFGLAFLACFEELDKELCDPKIRAFMEEQVNSKLKFFGQYFSLPNVLWVKFSCWYCWNYLDNSYSWYCISQIATVSNFTIHCFWALVRTSFVIAKLIKCRAIPEIVPTLINLYKLQFWYLPNLFSY